MATVVKVIGMEMTTVVRDVPWSEATRLAEDYRCELDAQIDAGEEPDADDYFALGDEQ